MSWSTEQIEALEDTISTLRRELNRVTRGDVSNVITTLGDALTYIGKLERERDQEWNAAIELALTAVPSTWLSDLLTGQNNVVGNPPFDGLDLERLMLAIRQRIEKLKRPA